jgi:hypothetical protein
MNISATSHASLYSPALTNQPAPVTRNNEGDRSSGAPEAKRAAVTDANGKPKSLDVVA